MTKNTNGVQTTLLVVAILAILGLVGAAVAIQLANPASTPSQTATNQAAASSKGNWLQFNFNPQHNGSNNQETKLNAANIGGLQKLFQANLPGVADGAPVYISEVTTASGVKNLVFVTTRNGDIVALDAATGSRVWVQHNPANGCVILTTTTPCYTTSSPAIDPNRQFVYSYGLEGYVHKYQVADGTEIKDAHWPELTTAKIGDEKGSSALATATAKNGVSYLYIAHAYYPIGGARKQNQGHLTTINLSDGTQHVFNTVCSDQADVHFKEGTGPQCAATEDGLWARNPVVYNATTDKIYLTSGCCTFDPTKHNWSETVFALNPDGTGSNGNPLDTYTPADFAKLDEASQIASSAPAILSSVPSNSKYKNLGAQSGKDGKLRLLNLDNLSGQGKVGQMGGELQLITLPKNSPLFTTLATWTNTHDQPASSWLFAASTTTLSAYKLIVDGSGNPQLQDMWDKSENGNSPIVVNNTLFNVHSHSIAAFDPTTGSQLWRSTDIGNIHWQSPIVVNGMVYVPDEDSKLTAFALK